MLGILVPIVVGGLTSVGIGAGIRYLMGDKTPLEPHEVALDFVLGAISGGTYGALSSIGSSAAKTVGERILLEGGKWAISGAVTDLAEDVLRKEIYSSPLNPNPEERKEWQKQPIQFHPEELLITVPLSFVGGAIYEGVNVGIEKGKIPTLRIGKVEASPNEKWYGVYIEKGEEAKPLLGIAKESGKWKPTFGDYEFPQISEPFFPVKPIETKLTKNALKDYYKRAGYDPTKALPPEALEYGYNIMKITKDINTEEVMSLKEALKQSPRLEDISDDLANWLAKQKGSSVVFGSTAQKMQMGEAMTRTTHDIDIWIKNPEQKAKEIVDILSKKGIHVRVNPENPTLVERFMDGRWVKILDLHDPLEGYYFSLLPMGRKQYIGYGFRAQEPLKTKEGYYIMKLSEQSIRKGVSSLTPQEYGFAPQPHRLKDIYDFVEITEYMAQQLEKEGKKRLANQLRKYIDAFISTISPELKAQILQQVGNIAEKEGFIIYIPEAGYVSLKSLLGQVAYSYGILSNVQYFLPNLKQSQGYDKQKNKNSEQKKESKEYKDEYPSSSSNEQYPKQYPSDSSYTEENYENYQENYEKYESNYEIEYPPYEPPYLYESYPSAYYPGYSISYSPSGVVPQKIQVPVSLYPYISTPRPQKINKGVYILPTIWIPDL